jgi:hypothetical protein
LVYERGGGTACHRSGRSLEVRDPVAPVSADRCSAGILLAGCAMALFGGQQSLGYLIGTGRHLSGKHESAHGARLLAGIWAPGKRRNGHAVVYASAARLRCSPPSKPAEENALTEVLSLMPVRVPPDIAISDAANGPALQERYGSRGFQAIDVAIDPNPDLLIENFAKDYQTKFPVGWASIDQMMNYMGFQGRPVVPQLVLIDRAGNIRYATPRLGDPDAMKQEFISSRIEELLAARR